MFAFPPLGDPKAAIGDWQTPLRRFLFCQSETISVDRLGHLLYKIGSHFSGNRIEVMSGCGFSKPVAGQKSEPDLIEGDDENPKALRSLRKLHASGQACDFRVSGVPMSKLRDYIRDNFEHVGVGFYPTASFLHLDTGPKAFWIDYSLADLSWLKRASTPKKR